MKYDYKKPGNKCSDYCILMYLFAQSAITNIILIQTGSAKRSFVINCCHAVKRKCAILITDTSKFHFYNRKNLLKISLNSNLSIIKGYLEEERTKEIPGSLEKYTG
ncbi:hypothetical protein LOAG_12444 [Loa loa]|uniref:Uncharacterized protein n=1 Tax=Loa loa TaxID=7209 RepID=A0A1S0TMN7_LOALO|nr:hypothetical protein LOAG_12444 [Loa loa]EFO16063.1 hypothetical protein LOAG_12444 [Loa loa]